jgi:transcriptional regulator of acetoin/glycerol metabolism
MLDLTGIQVPERPALKHLVAQSARRIENALVSALADRPHHLLLRLGWPGQTLGHDGDGLLAVDPHGVLLGHNPQAADMLGLLPNSRLTLDQVLATEPGRLFDLARSTHASLEVPLWSGLRLQVHAQTSQPTGAMHLPAHTPLRDVEDALIRQTVQTHKGNVAAAAKALGISRATVYRKLGKKA